MYTGIETIYLIHHSHTDIGYTHDQPIVWDLHRRFIETALDECERDASSDADHAFRWTVETTAMLMHWLESASDQQVARFVELARAGRIEVTSMLLNITPLFDTDQLIESLAPVRFVKEELGLPVHYAMNSDVNGQNWPLVDVLLDAGITGFSMATNIHMGGSPLAWPNVFHWRGPSGRTILAWNGWDYGFAREAGIDAELAALRDVWWPRIDGWLRERGYDLPVLMLQVYDAFGDNGPASPTLPTFVREWNDRGGVPRLRVALPSEWWAAVQPHADRLPTHRGDWTDYWNFGCGSSAREVAINRRSRARLRNADAAAAIVAALGGGKQATRRAEDGTRAGAWRALHLWDEHTWGADCSVGLPDNEDTITQWHHKASYAYTARSLSLMLSRDAVAELARCIEREPDDILVIFNPLPFPRTVAGPISEAVTRSVRGRVDDPTAARHWADRDARLRLGADKSWIWEKPRRVLAPTEVPPYGYALIRKSQVNGGGAAAADDATIDTARHRISFDRETGGITSWYSKALNRELVDNEAGWPFNGWVHEAPQVGDQRAESLRRIYWTPGERRLTLERGWQPGWPATRRGPIQLLAHEVDYRDDGIEVTQRLQLPIGGELVQQTYIPSYTDWIECTSTWSMGLETTPEATYLAFPLAVPGATARIDLGGQSMRLDADQLPRACRDYYTVQGWVDFSNAEFGVTVACPDAPMVQIGDFTFGANRDTVVLPRAMLLGWVTNNYWETNFRAHQPGAVSARYRLLPHAGSFDESAAHRFGIEAAVPPLFHHLQEPAVQETRLPRTGSLIRLPAAPVLSLHIWPDSAAAEAVYVRLLNASEQPTTAVLSSGVLQIAEAFHCDLLGAPKEGVMLRDGAVTFVMEPRALATLRLVLTSSAK